MEMQVDYTLSDIIQDPVYGVLVNTPDTILRKYSWEKFYDRQMKYETGLSGYDFYRKRINNDVLFPFVFGDASFFFVVNGIQTPIKRVGELCISLKSFLFSVEEEDDDEMFLMKKRMELPGNERHVEYEYRVPRNVYRENKELAVRRLYARLFVRGVCVEECVVDVDSDYPVYVNRA